MAGVVVHLAVADTVSERLGIKNEPLFYAGNIAPDCIHSRANYNREMKKHTHFKDGLRDWQFLLPENLSNFYRKLEEFAENYCSDGDDREICLGYLSHLITDEFFMKTVRIECIKEAEKVGIPQTDMRFFEFMMRELNWSDAFVAENFSFRNPPVETVRKAYGHGVRDYIFPEEIEDSNEWIYDNFFSGKKKYEKPVFMTPDVIYDFIGRASEEVCERFESLVKI